MFFFIRIILSFIINSLISPEERDYNNPRFNPAKIIIVFLLVINVFISIHQLKRTTEYYDFLHLNHPEVLEAFKESIREKEENKKTNKQTKTE